MTTVRLATTCVLDDCRRAMEIIYEGRESLWEEHYARAKRGWGIGRFRVFQFKGTLAEFKRKNPYCEAMCYLGNYEWSIQRLLRFAAGVYRLGGDNSTIDVTMEDYNPVLFIIGCVDG